MFKYCFIILFFSINLLLFSQGGYEIFILDASVNEFDVFGDESYEKSNRDKSDITEKLKAQVSVYSELEKISKENFLPKNLLDGNMKTCWLSDENSINQQLEIMVDLEETDFSGAQIKSILFINGWRNDLQTWKDYARVKKLTLSINDLPYAEVNLEDTYKQQSIDFTKLKIDRNRRCRIKIRIAEVYSGKKYKEVALSDLQLLGKVK